MPSNEPLAIVGMACRFPGNASNPAAFWELLRTGVDAITEVPEGRWNAARFHHANASAPGRMVTRWGGFVGNVDAFDAGFFGIAPREAARMDPQHRWLAEVAWEAMEDAALPPERLAGTRTGVFLGLSSSDYPMLHRRDLLSIDGYSNIGSALSIAANRLSFLFHLRGPSFAVDTACSSSLVALHLAAQSLRLGECDYALVGGASALLTPESSIGFSQARMLSPHGRCRAFDADADGYVRAEGAAAVLLMPLRIAQQLGLRPRALLVATASNQDGHSSSLTVPSQSAQEEMIREALEKAGARPRDVVYVEAHGTGTPVGDPIEAHAIAAVLSEGRAPGERLLIGSVKTNIGHLESASGMAGLIKAVLALEHRAVPANLHFTVPNPLLPLDRIAVPTALTRLPKRPGRTPLVAVNSFGFGGTNAHALLAPPPAPVPMAAAADQPCLFPLSARSPAALVQYAEAFAQLIATNPPPSLRDLCAAAALGKSHHPLRHAFVADSFASLQKQLRSLRDSAAKPVTGRPKVAFIFCGQGPQWWAMGRQLYREEKIVRDLWERCDAISQKLGGPRLLDALLSTETDSPLGHTDIAQPALFALQAGLVELWRTWGIEPAWVLGHSVGETAAAWAAGMFDLEEILRIIICRSRQQEKMHGLGRMLAAAISADDAKQWERRFTGRVGTAAFNAPRHVTLSGEASALEEIAAQLQQSEIFHRFLQTDYAFHSAQMDPIADGLRRELADVAGTAGKVPMISTVTGEPVEGPCLNAEYWWRNVRAPVQFAAGVERLLREGCTAFVEIGPHPVMASALAEIALSQKSPAVSVASLRRNEDERTTMLRGLAMLYQYGAEVRWDELYSRPVRALRLPAYPWQRHRLWQESADTARELRSAPSHPLLGDRQPLPQPTWLNHLDARLVPWLADHRLAGSAVLPAAAYMEMAAAAVREFLGESTVFLENIRFHRLLFLPDEQPIPTCVQLDPASASFQILAATPDSPSPWAIHAEGTFRPGRLRTPVPTDLASLAEGFDDERAPEKLYRELSEIGQVFGPAFQGLTSLHLRGTEALGEVSATTDRDSPDYLLFPPLFDACFHPSATIESHLDADSRAVVVSVRQMQMFQPLPDKVWSHLRVVEHSQNSYVADVTIHDDAGAVIARVDGLTVRALDSTASQRERDRKLYRMTWEPDRLPPEVGQPSGEVLIFSLGREQSRPLMKALREREIPATLISADAKGRASNVGAISVDLRHNDWAIDLWKGLAARGPLPSSVIFLGSWDTPTPQIERDCRTLLALAQARLAAEGDAVPARWLIVTHRAQPVLENEALIPANAAVWGFARSLQTEQPHWRVSLADCGDAPPTECLLRELFAPAIEPEIAFRNGSRWVRRMREFEPASAATPTLPPAYALQVGQVGRTDALRFCGRSRPAPEPGEVEVEIAAAGLNFRDLMKALGIYPLRDGELPALGDEFSGTVVRVGRGVRKLVPGDRVMGFAPTGGAFGSHLVLPADTAWKCPPRLGFAEAASIPVVFGTAYHALHTLARLRRGETVLIHAAAGGVGLAAVQLAQHRGAVVLATAGSEEKREMLRALGVAVVMDSRTLDFAEETLHFTGGRGVDVVLNSLAGAFQQKSLEVCAPHGRFVEIGKRDLFENHALPLGAFQRTLSFFAFDLAAVIAGRGPETRALKRFLSEGFFRGKLKPIPTTRFPAREAVAAFRLMQSAQHVGKIVLEFESSSAPEVPAEFWPQADGTYLITGGLTGFGLATARWLVERGARHLALLSRRGVASTADAAAIEAMRAAGVAITILAADVADSKSLADALRRLKKTAPPLRGVFHAAMVLLDATVAAMTSEELDAVLAPKVTGAWNLHTQTLALPLDCFVLFSSISSLVGAPGQANYAAANAFLDALAHFRRAQGLPALSINWGQIADVGVAAERPEIGRYLESIGVRAIPSKEALAALPRLIASAEAQAGVMKMNWGKLSHASEKFGTSPVFRDLARAGQTSRHHDHAAHEWRETILGLPTDEQVVAVSDLILAQLAATLGMPLAEIDRERPLTEMGMDSLMAVELKARIENHSGCELPVNLFNADLTTQRLAERFLKQLSKAPSETKQVTARSAPAGEAPLLRTESTPLFELVRAGELAPLTAAALMPWPTILLEQLHLSPSAFFQRMSGGRVSLDLIVETPLGSVGIVMLPLTAAQVNPREPALLPHLLDGITLASTCGAQCVALTGLIPSATGYGAAVQAACESRRDLAAVTTGHATTIAAVVVNLEGLLRQAGRRLEEETVMIYGIGSIGLGALRLMLDVLPHPAELRLYDPYRSASFFAELKKTLRRERGYEGGIRVVRTAGEPSGDLIDATVIVGATNVEDVIDVARLAPGTLVVDDSWPHCMNGPAALSRFAESHDLLCTEGGFVHSSVTMPRIAHLPPSIAAGLPASLPQLLFSSLNPHDITACILSALISVRRPDLTPTIGLIEPAAARRHWAALAELGFIAADLSYEGTPLAPNAVAIFRERFGKAGAPPLAVAAL